MCDPAIMGFCCVSNFIQDLHTLTCGVKVGLCLLSLVSLHREISSWEFRCRTELKHYKCNDIFRIRVHRVIS